jgi:hypothetical protein
MVIASFERCSSSRAGPDNDRLRFADSTSERPMSIGVAYPPSCECSICVTSDPRYLANGGMRKKLERPLSMLAQPGSSIRPACRGRQSANVDTISAGVGSFAAALLHVASFEPALRQLMALTPS